MNRRHRTVESRDAMPGWVNLRVLGFISDMHLKTLRDEVLQAVGFIVNFVDRVIEDLVKKSLELIGSPTVNAPIDQPLPKWH
jgi:hypothetical protein